MAVIVEFSLDSEAFPFGRSTSGDPEVRVQLERVVPLEQNRIPFLWATGSDLSRFERGLRDSEIVKHVEALTRVGDSVLYAVEWYESKEDFMNGIVEAGGSIMEAHGDDTWSFTLRFRNHGQLTRFHQFYQENEFPVHIDRVYTLDEEPATEYGFGLTQAQREAITLAVERGILRHPPRDPTRRHRRRTRHLEAGRVRTRPPGDRDGPAKSAGGTRGRRLRLQRRRPDVIAI